ncbi:SLBB domain-containing protein [Terriglobus albidus]|uniref:SLBB domain-containing protein n=1 Tax=Terriglobus albidus TaxID=1592106 RepID=UPI0021E0B5D8|nr:SLBB domain-containing protein [Terriglobus albidus]
MKRLVLICCCIFGLSTHLPAQSPSTAGTDDTRASQQENLRPQSLTDTSTQEGSASYLEVIRVLQDNPDAMIEVKTVIAEYLTQQGNPTQPDSISDQALYTRLQTNAELRNNVITFLRSRGYLTDAEAPGVTSPVDAGPRNLRPSNDAVTDNADLLSSTTAGRKTPKQPVAQKETPERQEDPATRDRVLHRDTPYNLTSLRDLYTQIPQPSRSLKRFGSEVFLRRNSQNAQTTPDIAADVPLGPEYVLGVGDNLTIALWGSVSQNLQRTIDREGKIVLPEAGAIEVAGISLEKAKLMVADRLRTQFRDIQVELSVARPRNIRIYVVGDVQRPGAYELTSVSSPLSALYAAGGPTAVGSLRILRHYRGTRLLDEIDLYDFMLHGVRSEIRLQSGDTLLVPPSGPQVWIDGAIKRPAIYELKGNTAVSTLVEDAGGPAPSAETSQIRIERITPDHQRETVAYDLRTTQEKPFYLRDGDRLFVGSVLPYSSRVIYTEGHLVRPGRTAYRDGMRITDVLHSYQDLLPEPADRGEIVRLQAPDLRPSTIEFSVSEALAGNIDLMLQPFDTIRVFGRYEADAPRVTIAGEVLRPGIYPLSEGMTAADLVRTAGGFKRDALLEAADLTSYQIVNGNRVVSQRSSIPIGAAVTTRKGSSDVVLRPGDVLTIHQIAGWNDIAASITVEGEVSYPGSYGIQQGERLSSILKRAGGFRETAYPAGAVLIREEVRVLEEKTRQELIRQIETSSSAARLAPAVSANDQSSTLQIIQAQQEQVLSRLKNQPAVGRLVIHISNDIASWEGTAVDIEVRAGDVLRIPKRPGFVLVNGQVYNATAITFAEGKAAGWYLRRAGGVTEVANEKQIFIIRANGSVVGRDSGFLPRSVLSTKLNPGDVVVVPQKILGASLFWRNLLTTAQLASSIAITAAVAGVL